ncbi:MAG: hypothetical protein GF329_03610 [Candidatus Lokiarchaeota archaeon]|nr:hypothetical protein [Candidatus Lokiarchaeota archaeon]
MTPSTNKQKNDEYSSFEKGIFNKLDENEKVISILMAKYIVANNSKWHSNDFPSSQIAKTILKLFKKNNMSFPVMHRIVKEILKTWKDQRICEYLRTTKYGHCRKTKAIYRFNAEGINRLKEIVINNDIKMIKKTQKKQLENMKVSEKDLMKSRPAIITEIKFNYEEVLYEIIDSDQFSED